MLKIDFCLQCGEIPIFCMLCVCFVFVFVIVEQIGPVGRARTKFIPGKSIRGPARCKVCATFRFDT